MPTGSAPSKATSETSSGATPGRADATRWLSLAGIVGPALFIVAVVAAGLTWPGFDHRVRNISDLGGTDAPHPLLLNATFVVVGALMTTFAIGLRRTMPTVPASGTVLVGLFGFSLVVQGATPCTPGCAVGTPADVIHVAAALFGITAVAMAAILTAVRASGSSVRHRRGSLVCGVAVLVLLGAWLTASGIDPDRLHAGVYQRLLFVAALTWLAATAVVAARTARAARTMRTVG